MRSSQGSAAIPAVNAQTVRPDRQPSCASPIGTVSTEARGEPDRQGGRVDRGHQPDLVGEVQLDQRGQQHVGRGHPGERQEREHQEHRHRRRHARGRRDRPRRTPGPGASAGAGRPAGRRRGARAPKTANARTGREVRMPVSAVDIRRPSLMSPRTGPTLIAAGRRLKASTTIPRTTRTRCARELRASVTPASCRRTRAGGDGVGAVVGGCKDRLMREVTDAQRRARLATRHALGTRWARSPRRSSG